MSKGPLSRAVAIGGDVEDLPLLGRLATYTFPDDPRPATKVVRAWNAHGLDVNDLPDVRSATHLFKSACRSVETRKKTAGKARVEVKVDEVANDAAECIYQITRMVRDTAQKVIEHPKAMTLRLDKLTDTITVRQLEDYAALRPLEEAIREHFAKHAQDLPGQKIRNAVRDTLHKIGAQNLRRKAGGLYFVPHAYRGVDANGSTTEYESKPILTGLQGFLADMYGDRADFYVIDLLDGEANERMVAKHFAINAKEHSRDLLERAVQRAAAGMGDRGIREDFMTSLYQEQRKLLGAVAQFEQMVRLEDDEVRRNLEDLDDAIRKLEKMREKGVKA